MSEHLSWCKSLQGATAKDCNCNHESFAQSEYRRLKGILVAQDNRIAELERELAAAIDLI